MRELLGILITICAVFGSLLPLSARAYSDDEREWTVVVPRSEINVSNETRKPKRPAEFSVSFSNWAPEDYQRGSYNSGHSKLERTSLPALSVNRLGEVFTSENLNLSTKFGGTYAQLERTTEYVAGSALTYSGEQRINFWMFRVGLESAFPKVLPWGFEPNMSFSAIPTWVTAQRSVYEDNVSGFGVPLEATVGLLWRTPLRASLLRGDLSLGVAYQTVSGSIEGSNLRGKGVLGELRISL